LETLNIGQVISNFETEIFKQTDILILSIKPQDFDSIKEKLGQSLNKNTTIISIMAGKTIKTLYTQLKHPFIVRAMPNSPAMVGMGITAYVIHPSIEVSRLQKVEKVLNAAGCSVF
jgi:pyrroline-5-carboxylate reductase